MHCSCVQTAVNALNAFSPVRATRKLLLPACTSAALPTLANAVPLTLLTVIVPPAADPGTVVSDGAFDPPPPGPAGLLFLPHPSMTDATVTSEIACAQNSRREVFELSMAPSRCKQRTRPRPPSRAGFAPRYGAADPALEEVISSEAT
jgi:hypothetical protein